MVAVRFIRTRCDPSPPTLLNMTHTSLSLQEQYDVEKEEEFEDSEGNVLDRRTFEDLARQGLL